MQDTRSRTNAPAVDSDGVPSLNHRPPDSSNSDAGPSRPDRDRHTDTAKHHSHVHTDPVTDVTSDGYARTG